MKRFDLCALGQAIVDILVTLNDEEFNWIGRNIFEGNQFDCNPSSCADSNSKTSTWTRGSWDVMTPPQMRQLLAAFTEKPCIMLPGGSVSNSIILFSQLGGSVNLIASLGDDKEGHHFTAECQKYNVSVIPSISPLPTGLCLSVITPTDRTMRVCLGAAAKFNSADLDLDLIADSRIVFLEGFFLSAGEEAWKSMCTVIDTAKANNTKIVFSVSATKIIENYRSQISSLVSAADLVFANEFEACELAGTSNVEDAARLLLSDSTEYAITLGERGSIIVADGNIINVPAFRCEPVDLTGAGDAYAGAYLYARCQGLERPKAASFAANAASHIIRQTGAHFKGDINVIKNFSL